VLILADLEANALLADEADNAFLGGLATSTDRTDMLLPKSALIISYNDGVAADLEQSAKVRDAARCAGDSVAAHLKLNTGE
jgi:hypothetical protein